MSPGFLGDRIFYLTWGAFLGLLTLFVLGSLAAPLFNSSILYSFYHLGCHQLAERSWFICGAKLGMCVRCFSTYLFLVLAGASLFIRPLRRLLERRSFLRFVFPVFLGLLSPLLVDGLAQIIAPWQSSNLLRFLTGSLAGAGLALFAGYLLMRFIERVETSLR